MNLLTMLFAKVFSFIFGLVGTFSVQDVCSFYFDEPEVPKELQDLSKK
ncbi:MULTISPECIES: cyclic lactone autoinducer peptide AgrD [Staphylococcus]|nr:MULTISPECIES: cyclic lactone autoinducer peptide [unclassified Staphylococcus]MBF2758375.1 cyclic lactone autoinducer peptide [Staphylococcus haemolyticus]MBF2773167.1 cyclic lactone autoinducer peptide [Staphylococcus haemolyticus]MBF2777386.1 cyclic lactone autoinducer peptide [Staphylococcus haemolyticus]MBF2815289.1 cyclic lactone autoinducer peptide [Staphylococcus haemolyticus]MBF9720595.1 cyclic lactone autoinducer peptide [Staphylococcus haemolyticus]